jgi:hypothetical protein
LQERVDEYAEIIDYLYKELDKQEADYESVMAYIDKYYEDEAVQPRLIAKHRIPNKGNKGAYNYVICSCYSLVS